MGARLAKTRTKYLQKSRLMSKLEMLPKAALETKQKIQTKNERMQRTRTLIQVGGLVSISGLLERFDIAMGDDLQLDEVAKDKSKIVMGVLMSVIEQLPKHLSEADLKRLSKKGESAMTTRAIQKDLTDK